MQQKPSKVTSRAGVNSLLSVPLTYNKYRRTTRVFAAFLVDQRSKLFSEITAQDKGNPNL